ncbi:MAG: hypothetical protein HY327_09360 [Chloroflexi bacterium]|nr:hypothetical protein [Chloroflexota bacterium]
MNLKPCPFRQVDNEGRILCDKIKTGEREVSPNICRACPISAINCAHLRATLDHRARLPITVRFGNGRTEIWDDVEPSIALERAACSAKVIPITSPRDCAGCPLRQALIIPNAIPVAPQIKPARAPIIVERRQPVTVVAAMPAKEEEPRKSIVAQKLNQLQEWLTKQKPGNPAENSVRDIVMPIAAGTGRIALPARGEEKRVGWTD